MSAILILTLLPPRLVWLGLFATLFGASNGVTTMSACLRFSSLAPEVC